VVVHRPVRRACGIEEVAHARTRVSALAEQAPGRGDELGTVAITTRHNKMIVEWTLWYDLERSLYNKTIGEARCR
jgi:hypothetical protein